MIEMHKEPADQKQLSAMTAQATAQREADHLKAELLGTVSHELRSPLAAIKGYAATLLRHERRLPRAERREFLQAIGEASDRLEIIIDRMLLLSQLEAGTVALQRAPVDVAPIAREALDSAERRISRTSPDRFTFALRLEDADGAPTDAVPLVLADPRWVREVLDNLLENATKYSPEGGVIEVALRPVTGESLAAGGQTPPTDSDRRLLEVRVRDQGRGIPREQLGRIFERFHRVDTRLAREGDGLGVGLTICQRLVALHGGAIWAESAPADGADGADGGDGGSTFHVLLPLAGPAGPAAAPGADDHPAAAAEAAAEAATGPSPTGP
jgi:signal transduction histidine kinase